MPRRGGADMKFLVSTWPTEEGLKTLPPSADFAAQIAWIKAHLADGTIEAVYHAPNRAVSVYNAASVEAVNALIDSIPLSKFMNRTVEPLTDLFEQMEGVLDYLRGKEASR